MIAIIIVIDIRITPGFVFYRFSGLQASTSICATVLGTKSLV